MEIQEVISQLENLEEHCSGMVDKEDSESPWQADCVALNSAIEALKKQVPMKVIEGRFAGLYDCPKCEGAIESREYQYCPSCGQKLDWRK